MASSISQRKKTIVHHVDAHTRFKGKALKFCFSLTLQWDAVQGLKHEIYGSRL